MLFAMRRSALTLLTSAAALGSAATIGLLTASPASADTASTAVRAVPAASSSGVPSDVPRKGKNLRKGEKPPVMPAAAKTHTNGGARSMAKFYFRTIDWGFATTDSHYMRHYFNASGSSKCANCTTIADTFDRLKGKGDYFTGDRYSFGHTINGPATGSKSTFNVVIRVNVSAAQVHNRHGKVISHRGAITGKALVTLKWSHNSWRVLALSSTQ